MSETRQELLQGEKEFEKRQSFREKYPMIPDLFYAIDMNEKQKIELFSIIYDFILKNKLWNSDDIVFESFNDVLPTFYYQIGFNGLFDIMIPIDNQQTSELYEIIIGFIFEENLHILIL